MKQLTIALYVSAALLPAIFSCNGNKGKDTVTSVTTKNKYARATTQELEAKGMQDLDNAQDLKTILCQNWDNAEDVEDNKASRGSDLEMLSRGYSFFNDGTMVKDPRGDYKQGTWELQTFDKHNIIDLKFADGTTDFFAIAKAAPRELTLDEEKPTTSSMSKLVDYKGEGIAHTSLDKEPFYKINNGWRIAPKRPESDEQLKARLKGMIHFYILFYDQCIDARSEEVSFAGLPSCYKWYAGGIFIKKEKEISRSWINCFYNEKQAMQAYKMADELVDKKYTWPKGETNWLKQNVYVLRQMEKNL